MFLDGQAGVQFTLYELKKELKTRGHDIDIPDLIESLKICNLASLTVMDSSGKALIQSPLFPVLLIASKADWMEKPKQTRCYVQFHPLVTASINHISYRQYDYLTYMTYKHRLSRWLHKRLAHNYVQASMMNLYSISLSTILRDSGAYQAARGNDRLREVETALDELKAKHVVMDWKKSEKRGARNKIIDITYTLYPDFSFVEEVKKANARSKRAAAASRTASPSPRHLNIHRPTRQIAKIWHSSPQLDSYPQKNMALQPAGRPKTWHSSPQVGQKHGTPARRSAKNMALQPAGRPKTWHSSPQVRPNMALQPAGRFCRALDYKELKGISPAYPFNLKTSRSISTRPETCQHLSFWLFWLEYGVFGFVANLGSVVVRKNSIVPLDDILPTCENRRGHSPGVPAVLEQKTTICCKLLYLMISKRGVSPPYSRERTYVEGVEEARFKIKFDRIVGNIRGLFHGMRGRRRSFSSSPWTVQGRIVVFCTPTTGTPSSGSPYPCAPVPFFPPASTQFWIVAKGTRDEWSRQVRLAGR